MIQGGDPEGTGYGGSKDKIKGEFSSNGVKNDLKHTRGVISMARSQDPNSASSQFFIMHADAPHLEMCIRDSAIYGAIQEALKCKETGEEKTILFGLTGTGYFDMTAYAAYLDGTMTDYIPTDEDLERGRAGLPKVD